MHTVVHMALFCVVSKYLRIKFRVAFFPTAGYREHGSGELAAIGSSGYYWAAVSSAELAPYLYCAGTGLYLNTYYRSRAYVLRCVQAFTELVSGWFFPSAGFRHYTAGGLSAVDSEGHCWSSVPSGPDAVRMGYFGGYGCFFVNNRSYGFSLRCVQVFTGFVAGYFFPSAGFCRSESGVAANIGSEGYYWSDFPAGSVAVRAVFTSGNLGLGTASSRCHAFPLRCVRAFTSFVSGCFLPVYGVPHAGKRGVVLHRFQWLCLDFVAFGYECPTRGISRFVCGYRYECAFVLLFVALCPRIYGSEFFCY